LRAEGFWEPMDLVAGYAADSGDLASALSGVPPWSVARPRRMPTFARRPATRLWATSIALLAQHRLAGPQRLLDRLSFASDTQKETALRAFGDVYGEQTQHVLHRLGRLALAGPPEELMAFVTSPLVCRDLFSDDANGRDAQTAAIFVALGLPEAAAATLKKAVESEPDSSALRMRLAGVLEALNRPDEAVAQYKEVLRQQPSSPEALRRMTGLLVASRRYREAAEYLERMVTQRPDDVPAMLMLGQIYVSTPGQREKAADLAQRVLALEPDNAAAHELLVLCGRAPSATVAP
jgi:tetratricopeptide (TPR) repeat protein